MGSFNEVNVLRAAASPGGCTGVTGNPHRVQRVALMRSIRKAKAFGLPTIPWTGPQADEVGRCEVAQLRGDPLRLFTAARIN